MKKATMIQTMLGKRRVVRRIGRGAEYYETSDGNWWVLNQQRGFVPVPGTSRGLALALAEAAAEKR